MSNIYYCPGDKSSSGTLRAVLSTQQTRCLLSKHVAEYAGQQFPCDTVKQAGDFAVLRIFEDEKVGDWKTGYYRVGADLPTVEESVQACTAILPKLAM